MNDDGPRVLQRLHREGRVRHPDARHQLERLAERGYRPPPPR
jgi:hypothetical protein